DPIPACRRPPTPRDRAGRPPDGPHPDERPRLGRRRVGDGRPGAPGRARSGGDGDGLRRLGGRHLRPRDAASGLEGRGRGGDARVRPRHLRGRPRARPGARADPHLARGAAQPPPGGQRSGPRAAGGLAGRRSPLGRPLRARLAPRQARRGGRSGSDARSPARYADVAPPCRGDGQGRAEAAGRLPDAAAGGRLRRLARVPGHRHQRRRVRLRSRRRRGRRYHGDGGGRGGLRRNRAAGLGRRHRPVGDCRGGAVLPVPGARVASVRRAVAGGAVRPARGDRTAAGWWAGFRL
ncbi:MAG: Aminoglycoside N(3)-acetyltransferase _ AAC(3)-II,III,IV,VI,VIII,IX,X, partial [uncultured Thermomicrobiales bacterium]